MLFAFTTEGYALFTKVQSPEYYETTARELFKQNKWSEGKAILEEGWSEFGSMSVMNELMGRYYYHFKKYDKARFYLTKALRDDRSNVLARELMVKVEEETGNFSSAICYINELLEFNPYNLELWRKKIFLYRKQGNGNEADRLLERLQQIYPSNQLVKNDVVAVNEQRLKNQRAKNNVPAQIETLQTLIKANPNEVTYYQQLCGVLSTAGRTEEAIEIAGRGAILTGNTGLMQRRAAMLGELGRYTEAMNYIKECMKKHPSAALTKCFNELEMSAAQNAQMNDPYTSMAKVYASQHNNEALNYLLNTSIARGYYEDALMYIKEAKQHRGEKEDLLYKEFIVNKRLGNKNKALSCLIKIHDINPKNSEVNEYLCQMRYADAADEMGYGQYSEAMTLLEFVQETTKEDDLRFAAMRRLFSCYFEAKHYDQAHEQLELIKRNYHYDNYVYQKAALYQAEGRTERALRFLGSESEKTMDPLQTRLLSYQYEEYAIPYVKHMIDLGMIRHADKAAKQAVIVCPTSCDLLHMAITTSDILGDFNEYEEMVLAGRARFPEDPFFISKEANVLCRQGDYQGAVDLLQPELNTFMGDSTLVRTYCDASISLALDQAKAKAYNSAIATIDTALSYKIADPALLITKGNIYEKMGQYDSAYVYQQHYKPSLTDYRQHIRHLEELKANTFRNEVMIGYQGGTTSLATLTYNRREKNDDISADIAYTGGDKGSAIRLGAEWYHSFNTAPWIIGIGAAWGNKAFPEVMARLNVRYKLSQNSTIGIHAAYRSLRNTDDDVRGGLTYSHNVGIFNITAKADCDYFMKKCLVGGSLTGKVFPIENSRTNIFATVYAGNAASEVLLDNAAPFGYNKLNAGLEAGINWIFSRYIAGTLKGSWYNIPADNFADSQAATTYSNAYFVEGKIHVTF